MRTFILSFLIMIFTPLSAFAKEPVRTIEGTVNKIFDGDTLQMTDTRGNRVTVRLYGIDAPEAPKGSKKAGRITNPGQPFGTNAQKALEEMVLDKYVRVDVMAVDQHKMTVAIVWIVDRIINKEMLKYGWAWAYRKKLSKPYAAEYISLEEQARKERRGIWEQVNPQPPWEFRQPPKKSKRRR